LRILPGAGISRFKGRDRLAQGSFAHQLDGHGPMIGIVVPAHNEEDVIVECVAALVQASRNPRLKGEDVLVVVVTDSCTDLTAGLAAGEGATTLPVSVRNVGMARAAGAQ
jgi:glycosyltransferase involved in cell wall biosynthesis